MRILLPLLSTIYVVGTVLAQPELTVVTCNMMGMKPNTQWDNRLALQIDQLSALKPDFVLLQEVCETLDGNGGDNMALTLAAGLSQCLPDSYEYYFAPTDISWGEFQEGIAIVSRYPILQSGFRVLTPGALERKVIWIHVETETGLVNLFCTHLSYRDDHEHIRMQQVQEIHEFIEGIETFHPAYATLVCGDFNCLPDSAPYIAMINDESDHSFIDCYRFLHPDRNGYTFPSDHPEKRVDFIFLRQGGNLQPMSASTVLEISTDDGLYPSDHLSLVVRLEVKQ